MMCTLVFGLSLLGRDAGSEYSVPTAYWTTVVPAGQVRHVDEADAGWYRPNEQLVHCVESAGLICPGAHGVLTLLEQAYPAEQGLHA